MFKLFLDRYINDNDNDLVAVSESHGQMLGFKKYDVYNSRLQTHGGISSVNNLLESYEGEEVASENLDVVFVFINSRDTEVLVGSIYARRSDEPNFMEMISCFNAAKNHCSKNQVKSPFFLADFNARHTAWGDIKSNGYGKNLFAICGSEGFVVSSP